MTRSNLHRVAASSAALLASASLCVAAASLPADAAPTQHAASAAAPAAQVAARAKSFTFLSSGSTLHGKDTQVGLFYGALHGGGKDISRGQSDVVSLPGGTITLKHPDSQSTFTPKVNQKTCYASFTLTGKFTVAKGTGRYRGLDGSGTYRGKGHGYLKRTKSGDCSMRAEPSVELFNIVAKGTLD